MKNLSQYIGVAYRRSQVFYNEQMSSVGLTSGQYMYIIAICEEEGLSQDDLAHQLHIDKGQWRMYWLNWKRRALCPVK
mgnify:CR=1 FL=1